MALCGEGLDDERGRNSGSWGFLLKGGLLLELAGKEKREVTKRVSALPGNRPFFQPLMKRGET